MLLIKLSKITVKLVQLRICAMDVKNILSIMFRSHPLFYAHLVDRAIFVGIYIG
ncbi:hypothetical protein AusDCA_2846 [Desulfitobacterium sp. AusDCA]